MVAWGGLRRVPFRSCAHGMRNEMPFCACACQIGENVICPSFRRSRPFSRSRFRAEEKSPNDPHGSWRPARRQHHSTHDPAGALRSAPPKPTGVDHLHKPTKPSADVLLDHVGLAAEWGPRAQAHDLIFWERLGHWWDLSGKELLRSGAAKCPCGVVRQVVLATRRAPATMWIVWGTFPLL